MRDILFRGKRLVNGEWVEGYITMLYGKAMLYTEIKTAGNEEAVCAYKVIPDSICEYTGLTDKNGKRIFEGDIVRLVLEDGEVRHFQVSITKVVRKVVNHPSFIDSVSKVEITGVVFKWNGFELFPCVDNKGVVDYSKMEVIGNKFDNPELLEVTE